MGMHICIHIRNLFLFLDLSLCFSIPFHFPHIRPARKAVIIFSICKEEANAECDSLFLVYLSRTKAKQWNIYTSLVLDFIPRPQDPTPANTSGDGLQCISTHIFKLQSWHKKIWCAGIHKKRTLLAYECSSRSGFWKGQEILSAIQQNGPHSALWQVHMSGRKWDCVHVKVGPESA